MEIGVDAIVANAWPNAIPKHEALPEQYARLGSWPLQPVRSVERTKKRPRR